MSLFKNSISSFIDYVISVIYTIDSLSNICITLLMVYDIIYLKVLLFSLLLPFLLSQNLSLIILIFLLIINIIVFIFHILNSKIYKPLFFYFYNYVFFIF